jgi:hypothetical protein
VVAGTVADASLHRSTARHDADFILRSIRTACIDVIGFIALCLCKSAGFAPSDRILIQLAEIFIQRF